MARLVTFGWVFGPLTIWMYVSVKRSDLAGMPIEVVGLILSVLGFKVGQKIIEERANGKPNGEEKKPV